MYPHEVQGFTAQQTEEVFWGRNGQPSGFQTVAAIILNFIVGHIPLN